MAETHTGTCFCGAVEVEVTGTPLEMGYCHCDSCRRYSGAPLSAFVLWRQQDVKVSRGADLLGRYQKTEMSDRQHCRKCGGHVLVEHPGIGLTHVHPASFPSLRFEPTVHLHYAETVLPIRDGIRKLKDFPAEVGGSGQVLPE